MRNSSSICRPSRPIAPSSVSDRVLRLGVLVLLGLLPLAVFAAAGAPGMLLYRYVDSRGVTVLDRQGVPPEYIAKGYQVLNQNGRVVQTVPPAPTAEEIRLKQQVQAKAAADAQLLDTYPSLADLDKARARKLSEVDTLIAVAQANVQTLRAQQASMQAQAAVQERAGQEVSQSVIDQLKDLQDQISGLQARIQAHQQARLQADADFAAQRIKLVALLGESPAQ